MTRRGLLFAVLLSLSVFTSCGNNKTEILRTFPVNSLNGLVDSSLVAFDPNISADSGGSLRIVTDSPLTVPLYLVDSIGVDDCRLIYRTQLRTEAFNGQVYLEMWCHFPDLGEYFTRNLDQTLSGTNDWTTSEAVFFLKPGQTPDFVRLNLVAAGSGTVWIDRIELLKAPL